MAKPLVPRTRRGSFDQQLNSLPMFLRGASVVRVEPIEPCAVQSSVVAERNLVQIDFAVF